MNEKGDILSEKNTFQGAIFDVVDRQIKTPDGLTVRRQVVLHGDAVAFIAPVHIDDQLKFVLAAEYRAGPNAERISFPAGLINDGEDPKTAALREAAEETGLHYDSAEIIYLISTSEGFTNEKTYLMLLSDLAGKGNKKFDKDEFVKTKLMTFDELEEAILKHQITTAPAIIGYQWLKMHPEILKQL
ncbi:NUDIX hydrolase [Oenococcus alcoholitolerans]|uniref:NUDIX hydrolase n=1 Tax=Oenococcus alcoholitolerans TaxID=931074 RepID=UPI003F6F4C6D